MKKSNFLAIAAFLIASPSFAADVAASVRISQYNWSGIYAGVNAGYAWTDGDTDGGVVGGTLGTNWQTGNLVLGLEADIAWGDLSNSASATSGGITLAETVKANWFGTARGRIGVAFDRVMIYGTGGALFTSLDHNGVATGSAVGSYSVSNSLSSFVYGGGVEWAAWDRWTVKVEYLRANLDRHTNIYGAVAPAIAVTYSDFDFNLVRFGVNYHF